MMTVANVPMVEQYCLFQEAANHSTKLDWLTVIKNSGEKKIRIEYYGMPIPAWSNNLHTRGEAGTVKTGKDGKIGDRGVTMIFVGFANKHGPDVYRMLNPHTRRTTNNRDVIWLNHMYYVTSCFAITKMLPEISIPTIEGVDDDHSDNESQYESTLPEERREDIVNNNSSEKSSDSETDSSQQNWVRHITRSGRKTGLLSG